MLRKGLSVLLTLSIWSCASRPAMAQTGSTTNQPPANTKANQKQAQRAERVKAHVGTLGTGPGARIELLLQDGTKVKGHVTFANEEHFVVADDQTGITTRMAYRQVMHIKSERLNRDKEIAIGVALGLMLLLGAGALHGGP